MKADVYTPTASIEKRYVVVLTWRESTECAGGTKDALQFDTKEEAEQAIERLRKQGVCR